MFNLFRCLGGKNLVINIYYYFLYLIDMLLKYEKREVVSFIYRERWVRHNDVIVHHRQVINCKGRELPRVRFLAWSFEPKYLIRNKQSTPTNIRIIEANSEHCT